MEQPLLEGRASLHVDLPGNAYDRCVVTRGYIEDREIHCLVHLRTPILPTVRERETQLRDGSSGIRATSANCPPLRSSTLPQSASASSAKTSSGRAGSVIQSSRASSSSSWPAPQPA